MDDNDPIGVDLVGWPLWVCLLVGYGPTLVGIAIIIATYLF